MGTRIRNAREARGMTQDALGGLVGVKQQSVAKWENGSVEPSTRRLRAIAEACGTTIYDLLGQPAPNEPKRGAPTDPEALYGPEQPDERLDDSPAIQLSAQGMQLHELAELDPEAYDALMRQAEIALDRARERRDRS